jgi:hypothetical protein
MIRHLTILGFLLAIFALPAFAAEQLASDRMSYPKALSGRFQQRQDVPAWLRVPRWCTRDEPYWRKGETAEMINGYADRHADCMRLGTFWGGVALFSSDFAPRSPKLVAGVDPLKEAIETVRWRHMHLLAYINPNMYLKENPLQATACVLDEAGAPIEVNAYGKTGRFACGNHPAFAEFYKQAIREIIERYGADGIYVDGLALHACYCPHCRAKFKKDTGRDLPPGLLKLPMHVTLWEMTSDWDVIGDVQNPEHVVYSRWLMKCLTDVTRLFTETTKAVKPGAVAAYHTWPKPDILPYYDATLNEIYAKRPWHFTLWKQAEFANWGDVFEVPSLVNVYLQEEPWGKPRRKILGEVEARQKYWQSLANGGSPNAWAYPGMERPFAVMAEHADCFDFTTTVPTRFLALARPMFEEAGSRQKIRHDERVSYTGEDKAGISRFLSPATGMYAGLLHAGLPVKQIHSDHLTREGLAGFRVLVLANEACLSDQQCAMIRDLVRQGMALVATHETSLYDLQGRKRDEFGLADVFGAGLRGTIAVEPGQMVRPERDVPDPLLPPAGLPNHEDHLLVEAKGARVVARLTGPGVAEPGAPAVLTNQYGNGRVVYLPGRLDSSYSKWGEAAFRQLVRSALLWASPAPMPAEVTCADGLVGVTCFDQPAAHRRLVHLVSYQADWAQAYDKMPLLGNVQIRVNVPAGEQLASARAILSGQAIEVSPRDGRTTLVLPRLEEYEIVELKWQ